MGVLHITALVLVAQGAATPSPAQTPCSQNAVVTRMVEPDGWYGLTGTSVIKVTVAPDGSVSDAKIVGKSGNDALDVLTYQAAVQSQYRPKVVQCSAVTTTFIFFATYDGRRVQIRAREEEPKTTSKAL